jgi:Fe2+ or Zn2+ uptake regulation protein
MDLLKALFAAKRPLTHAEILHRLRGAAFNRVSLYRALDALVNAGLIHRVYLEDRAWAYESSERCKEHVCHPHFTCHACGNVTCINDAVVPLVKLPKGYVVERQKVHLDGVCADCSLTQGVTK